MNIRFGLFRLETASIDNGIPNMDDLLISVVAITLATGCVLTKVRIIIL